MKVRSLVLVALFAALMYIGSLLKIPMLLVPLTLQLLFCLLAGALLGPRLGALSQILYIAIGLLGLPVFAGDPGGGFGYVLRPSFGFLLGFIACALVNGLILEKIRKLTYVKALLAALAGIAAVYAIGVPYLYFTLQGTAKAVSVGTAVTSYFLVFLPGDVLKCAVAAALAIKLRPVLLKQKAS